MTHFLRTEALHGYVAAFVFLWVSFDVEHDAFGFDNPFVPTLFHLIHRRKTFSHTVNELHITHVLPCLHVICEDILSRFVVSQVEHVKRFAQHVVQHLLGHKLQLFYLLAEQPCGCAVVRSHVTGYLLQITGKFLNIAHHHHRRQAAVFGTLDIICYFGCQ